MVLVELAVLQVPHEQLVLVLHHKLVEQVVPQVQMVQQELQDKQVLHGPQVQAVQAELTVLQVQMVLLETAEHQAQVVLAELMVQQVQTVTQVLQVLAQQVVLVELVVHQEQVL